MAVPTTPLETLRARVVRRFEAAFGPIAAAAGSLDPAAAAAKARNLELVTLNWAVRSCERDGVPAFEASPRFRFRYTTRALGLERNLRDPLNPRLRERVLSGELGVRAFANMRPEEMCPERWEAAYAAAERRRARLEAPDDARDAPDGAHVCGGCRSRKTTYFLLQTRSADEPATAFVRCLDCGKRWRHSA